MDLDLRPESGFYLNSFGYEGLGPRFLHKKGGGGSAPAAPDPVATAAAQTATNKETAYWNAVLNNVNQITPYGNLTYEQNPNTGPQYNYDAYNNALASYNTALQNTPPTPSNPQYGGGGGAIGAGGGGNYTYELPEAPKLSDFKSEETPPSFTSTITLSPEQQAIYDTQTAQQQHLLDIGGDQLGRIENSVSTPYSYDGINELYGADDLDAARQRTEEALYSRLNPQFDRDEEALRTRLVNQGIGAGSEAYGTEFERFNNAKNDARYGAVLAGGAESDRLFGQSLSSRQQGINEYDTTRNAPLNEYIGLTSGTQVRNPQFSSTGYQGAQPVDYAGLVNQNYQNQLGQYNAKQAGSNNLMSSLFGLGGSFLGGPAGGAIAGSLGFGGT